VNIGAGMGVGDGGIGVGEGGIGVGAVVGSGTAVGGGGTGVSVGDGAQATLNATSPSNMVIKNRCCGFIGSSPRML
jgi:hypothetical protein